MSDFLYETQVIVKMDEKISGTIKSIGGGFAYFPKNSKDHGEILKSIEAVKATLEER